MSTYPTPAQKQNRKCRFGWKVPVTAVVAGGLGLAAGAGATADPASVPDAASEPAPTATVTATPEPAPTVTETVTPEPEVITETVTEEVEVEVTPASCADALDSAEEVFGIYDSVLDISGQAIESAAQLDHVALNGFTGDIEALTPQMQTAMVEYYLSAEECRS